VLYGMLESAFNCESHIRDAERIFNRELAAFLREEQREDLTRAERARELLAGRTSLGVFSYEHWLTGRDEGKRRDLGVASAV